MMEFDTAAAHCRSSGSATATAKYLCPATPGFRVFLAKAWGLLPDLKESKVTFELCLNYLAGFLALLDFEDPMNYLDILIHGDLVWDLNPPAFYLRGLVCFIQSSYLAELDQRPYPHPSLREEFLETLRHHNSPIERCPICLPGDLRVAPTPLGYAARLPIVATFCGKIKPGLSADGARDATRSTTATENAKWWIGGAMGTAITESRACGLGSRERQLYGTNLPHSRTAACSHGHLPCLTLFDYTTNDFGAEWANILERVRNSRGRMQLHVMRVPEGNQTRLWVIPLRTSSSHVHDDDALRDLAKNFQEEQVMAELEDILDGNGDRVEIHWRVSMSGSPFLRSQIKIKPKSRLEYSGKILRASRLNTVT
ncbi:hypothetical protein C8R45DRAFT_944747 [Mycena sanguinolenta]|nr:hypothetical protein C8R45DRAFT_944747 [Mycena sanguinolenta]